MLLNSALEQWVAVKLDRAKEVGEGQGDGDEDEVLQIYLGFYSVGI